MQDKCEKMERKAAREFEAEQKIFFENKANRDLVDDSLIKLWRDYHDKVQCKSKKIFEKVRISSFSLFYYVLLLIFQGI